MIEHERLTGWIRCRNQPRYRGSYEGKNASGDTTRFFYELGGSIPPDITHWRGQYTVLDRNSKVALQRILDSFRGARANPVIYDSVANAAIRLARHFAGPNKTRKGNRVRACTLLRIAQRLGAQFEQTDKDYLESQWAKLSKTQQAKVADNTRKFVGSLGVLDPSLNHRNSLQD